MLAQLSGFATNPTSIKLISSDEKSTVVQLQLTDNYTLHPVETSKGTAYTLSVPNATPILKAGAPDLAKITTSVIIPNQYGTNLEVINSDYTDFANINIAPSKGNLSRNINPANVPFTYSSSYQKNEFFPSKLADTRQPYILRDYRAQTIVLYPFQYNPVTKVLRVYHNITVSLKSNHQKGINELTQTANTKSINPEFASIYQNQFLNYQTQNSNRYNELSDLNAKLLVITHNSFSDIIQPLVDWKIRRGIPTQVVDVATIGDEQAIRTYIADQYHNNQITHVLLVGDAAQVPSLYSNAADGYSDVLYGCIEGIDSYPEVFIGRFSGETTTHIRTQVQRTMDYEINPTASTDWLKRAVCIASNEGPGDDNEMDWEHQRNIRTDLLNYTYNTGYELYDGSQGGEDAAGNPSAAQLVNIINGGVGVMSYTGHGYEGGCATTGLDMSDVYTLQNMGKLPFFWSVACVNGAFVDGTCFAESLLRSENNGQPIGCVATLMSTINQSWNPPMSGQDEMVDILTEQYDDKPMRSFGGISYNGCMQMNDDYGTDGEAMTDSWTCFGDPTLMVRTDVPANITAQHEPAIILGNNTYTVSSDVEGAFVSLVIDGQIVATGTISGGMATLNFVPLTNVGTMYVTLTAFNHTPYLGQASIVPGTEPFVVANNTTLIDANGNNIAENGETAQLNVVFKNLGPIVANNAVATLSTSDINVTISDNTENLGNVSGSQEVSIDNAFAFAINPTAPDQHVIHFIVTVTDDLGNSWTSYVNYVVSAPALQANSVIVDDSFGGNNNGRLDPGETVAVTIPTLNNGHATSADGIANIATTTLGISFANNNTPFTALAPNAQVQTVFGITASPTLPIGSQANFTFTAQAGGYNTTYNFALPIGLIVEDFESGGFAQFDWSNGGNQPWGIDTNIKYEGNESAKSGNIGNSQTSVLQISRTVAAADSVSFFKRVSSEQDWDYLTFYIDGVEMDAWSGVVDWSREAYLVSPGEHTFTWTYAKDDYYIDNDDAAWVDFISLPADSAAPQCAALSGTISVPNTIIHQNETFTVTSTAYNTDFTQWYAITTNTAPYSILQINTTGTFSLLMGDYAIYAINAEPTFVGSTGTTIEALQNNGVCLAISPAAPLNIAAAVGIDAAAQVLQLQLSPVPAHDVINVQFAATTTPTTLTLYDVTGKVLEQQRLPLGSNQSLFSLQQLSAGTYMISYNNGIVTQSVKFVKQ